MGIRFSDSEWCVEFTFEAHRKFMEEGIDRCKTKEERKQARRELHRELRWINKEYRLGSGNGFKTKAAAERHWSRLPKDFQEKTHVAEYFSAGF